MSGATPAPAASGDVEFGNLEANLRFLERSGVVRPGARVLEIGSGRGSLLNELRERGLDIVGVEISGDRVSEARERFPTLPILKIDGIALPFGDAEFDLVLSFDVFEHIADSDGHLAEVRRVLKPGGRYLLQTPNKWSNTLFETIRWRSFSRWRVDHCALHSARELETRLQRSGFQPAFADVPVVTPFFRAKVRQYLGWAGAMALTLCNPDRLPVRWRTNLFVTAAKR